MNPPSKWAESSARSIGATLCLWDSRVQHGADIDRRERIVAGIADPDAVWEVVETLRSERVKVAGPWSNGRRYALGVTNPGGYPTIAGQCLPLIESCSCQVYAPWRHWHHDGPTAEARREIDARLRAAGWLLCGESE